MAVDLNDPEVKAALEAAVEEAVNGLKKKNSELLRKLEAAKEIKPEDFQRALEERDAAQAKLADVSKELRETKGQVKSLDEAVKAKHAVIERTLIDDHLTNALVKANVRPEFMEFVKSYHRGTAKVVEENGEYRAVLGDKPIADAISAWAASDAGKAVIAAPANGGGGASGSGGSKGQPRKVSQAEFEALDPVTRKDMVQKGEVEIV